MFKRKPKQEVAIRVTPELPHFISREAKLLEMLEADRREHEGNIRICSDLIALRDRLKKAAEYELEQGANRAAEFDFAAKTVEKMIDCLQGEAPDLQPVISASPLANGSAEASQDEPRAIGFLSK